MKNAITNCEVNKLTLIFFCWEFSFQLLKKCLHFHLTGDDNRFCHGSRNDFVWKNWKIENLETLALLWYLAMTKTLKISRRKSKNKSQNQTFQLCPYEPATVRFQVLRSQRFYIIKMCQIFCFSLFSVVLRCSLQTKYFWISANHPLRHIITDTFMDSPSKPLNTSRLKSQVIDLT